MIPFRFSIPLSFLLLFLITACGEEEHQNGLFPLEEPEKIDALIDNYVSEGLYPFVYVRLEGKDGDILYEHGSTNTKYIPEKEVDGTSWIRIWSMSKIVTISLVLDLIEDGILSLSDPVTKYIPEFVDLKVATTTNGERLAAIPWGPERANACPVELVPNDSVMTILHLINHKAGFYYATTGFDCLDSLEALQNLPKAQNTDEFIQRIAKLPLVQHPGEAHFYGINTTILGFVAERATGKSLKNLVKERITDPMLIQGLQYAIDDTSVLLPSFSGKDSMLREAYPGELDIFGPDVPDYDMGHELYLGGEGMLATADGYADFLRMLLKRGTLNGHVFLEESTVADIHAPHTQLDNPYGYNGYNLWVTSDSMRIKGHGDAGLWTGGGYEGTHFWIDPKREFVGVIMSQMNFNSPEGYSRDDKIRGAIYQQLFVKETN